LTLLGFFLSYAQPIADGHTKSSILRSNDGAAIAPLYALDPIAGHVTRLDVPPQLDIWGVSASPDGKHLVYRGQVPGSADGGASPPSDIYVADIDGKHAARITRTGRHDTQAAWSADGKWIAYISFPAGTSGNNSLHIIHPDGTGDRTIVDGVTRLSTPAWSPDGSHIVYGSRNGQSDMLAIADVASGATHWLTFSKDAELPAWFGARLFFTASGGSLVSTNVDGSDPRQIAAKGQTVAVSPDGKTIAYLARADGATQVFLAGGDGGHARNVSRLAGIDAAHPSIGPDGRVYFTAFSRPAPAHTFAGYSLAEASNLLESVLVAGILLIVLRRWRPPFGSITFALTLFSASTPSRF